MAQVVEIEVRPRKMPSFRDRRDRREYESKPRVYFWLKDDTVLNHLMNTRRDTHLHTKVIKPLVIPALTAEGVKLPNGLKYSRKAGCQCGCSPGFIADGAVFTQHTRIKVGDTEFVNTKQDWRFDVFLTIGDPDFSVDRLLDDGNPLAGD